MTTKQLQLSRGVFVRLPQKVLERIESESLQSGVPLSTLIRKAVMQSYSVAGDYGNIEEDTTKDESEAT